MELATPIALVCVAGLAWDLGRKYLADRKQAYNARLTALLHEIDRERSDRTQQYADLRTVVNLKHATLEDKIGRIDTRQGILEVEHGKYRGDFSGHDLALNRIDEEHDELRSRVNELSHAVGDLSDRPVEPPDITALIARDAWLEAAIKNLGIEARSELAQRVTKAELEGELKNVRTTQAGMLALGGRRR